MDPSEYENPIESPGAKGLKCLDLQCLTKVKK